MRTALAAAALAAMAWPDALRAQAPHPQPLPVCADSVGAWVAAGWREYRLDRILEAGIAFDRALACDPEAIGAQVGAGYAALRRGQDRRARARFDSVLERAPENVDAIVGLGLLAWRGGAPHRAADFAGRALELDPENEDASALYARASPRAAAGGVERRPPTPRDTLAFPARTRGDRFEVRTATGWEPFYWKGVNLGAALPGRHPSEFPDEATYATWIAEIAGMGANVVRVYTVHPPAFYRILESHNRANPESPLWLVHGVWTELPPFDDYEDPVWESAFFEEMRRVVDLVHGSVEIGHRPGHASGEYRTDVSRWVLAYVIGREWEPFSVRAFNEMRPTLSSWDGRYLTLDAGTPMDVWLAKACEEIVAYETETYRAQRPVSYTNWPTLDPMRHATETTVAEEISIREALGEEIVAPPHEYDNDGTHLDAARVRPTAEYAAGYFVSFHAYPYYPDFMVLDPEYLRSTSPFGPSNYFGYLRALKRAHPNLPVVIAEYGVPASLGIAHLQPQGWHHGGHTERAMADIDARLTREIAAAGMAGGVLFAWIDEWFKKNWLTIDFEIPRDRNRLWLNRLDAEQHYGVFAMDPAGGPPGGSTAERARWWAGRRPLYTAPDGSALRAAADEAYLWLRFEGPIVRGARRLPAYLDLGFDTVDPEGGDRRWPGGEGEALGVGLEYALRIGRGRDGAPEARLLADPPSNPFRLVPVRTDVAESAPRAQPSGGAIASTAATAAGLPPAGTFQARREQRFNRPYRTVPNEDGAYDSLRVITNRPRFARDGTEYLGVGYDRGVLPQGPPPDGLWARDEQAGAIEVRIPWALLGFTDPSERRVLQELPEDVSESDIGAEAASGWAASTVGLFGTVTVPDIGIAARWALADGDSREWPGVGAPPARFTWETWDTPRWAARRRPVYDAMREAFAGLRPTALAERATEAVAGGGR